MSEAQKPKIEEVNYLDSLASSARHYENCKSTVAEKARELKIAKDNLAKKEEGLADAERALASATASIHNIAKKL